MKARVTIRTDSVKLIDGRIMEGRSSLELVLAALHHETSTHQHLKDLPWAHLSIEVCPIMDVSPKVPLSLNKEANG